MADECKHGIEYCATCEPPVTTSALGVVRSPARYHHLGGKAWSADEDRLAADPTVTDEEIAAQTGRTAHAVHMHRLARKFVAKKFTRTINPSDHAMERWTPGEYDYLVRRRSEGATFRVIAEELGRTLDSVERRSARGRPDPS